MSARHWWFGHYPSQIGFDGVSLASRCAECGVGILRDSQGNWFEVSRDGHCA